MTDREIMQQALEALEEINKLSIGEHAICLPAEIDGAMDALRGRLAQPEPPPECKTEEEKTAFAFGYWKAMEAQQLAQPDPMPLFDDWGCPPCNQHCEQGRKCPARGKV